MNNTIKQMVIGGLYACFFLAICFFVGAFSIALSRGEQHQQVLIEQAVQQHKFDVEPKYCINQCVDATLEKLNVKESQFLGGASVATMGVQQDPLAAAKSFCAQFYDKERCCSGYGIDKKKTVHGTDYGICKP